jgi:hypothetical protein
VLLLDNRRIKMSYGKDPQAIYEFGIEVAGKNKYYEALAPITDMLENGPISNTEAYPIYNPVLEK